MLEIEGEPWFVASNICKILEISNPRDAISRLDDDEKNTVAINDGIGNPNKNIINESGLYSLILTSRKPEAKTFKKWVTSEVLPSIRKKGVYINEKHPDILQTLKLAVQEIETKNLIITEKDNVIKFQNGVISEQSNVIEQKDRFIQKVQPKLDIYNQFLSARNAKTIEEFTKEAKIPNPKNPKEYLGRTNMFKLLRCMKVLTQTNLPMQTYTGYFNVINRSIFKGNLNGFENVSIPLLTPEGAAWLYKKIKSYLDNPVSRGIFLRYLEGETA